MQQFCPASGGHGDPGGKLVAGGDIAHRRIAGGKSRQRQAVRVHRQAAAGHAVVFQHLPGAGVAGGLHGSRAGQQRCQQPQQIFQPCAHHQLLRVALHAPVLGQIPCQRLPQGGIAPGVPGGEQLRRGIEQFLLQPRPCAEGEQPRVHAPGGQVELHRRGSIGGGRCRRCRGCGGRLRPLRQGKILLHRKPAALPGSQVALGCQHLVGGVHRVHRHRQLRRQPPLAGHPGARRQSARPHLGGKAAVELLVQRHRRSRVQRRGQMYHRMSLLCRHFVKLTP